MKIVYIATTRVKVTFDGLFSITINDELNKIQDRVEEIMWDHHFDSADIMNGVTGKLLMTIKKDY